MGTNIPNSNTVVSKSDLLDFLTLFDDLVGYTLLQADGYWYGVSETSFILQIATNRPNIVENVGRRYKLTFSQESVMLISPDGSVNFMED
ncbi:DUF3574 domain-containing protein [Candidatus Gracilibacteria bacterium]|nr:DUF3574 domain-containing protein [Candidatus Gracilibacteria bacterium]NJS41463.1 DUF3574 domain-containing protein [Candidatus Gracilibacteria bacterium]